MMTKKQKKDSGKICGEANGRSKLKKDQVKRIRVNALGLSQRKLAERYGVGKTTIYDIQHKLSWKHI
jgi:transposase